MKTKEIFEKFIKLNNATKNFIDIAGNNAFDLEEKILFFISCNKDCCPMGIIDEFKIKKTNLAIICKSLLEKNLITKQKDPIDGRSVKYQISKKGEEKIFENLNSLEKTINSLTEQNISQLCVNADAIIKILKK